MKIADCLEKLGSLGDEVQARLDKLRAEVAHMEQNRDDLKREIRLTAEPEIMAWWQNQEVKVRDLLD
jgi:hypothetical protein